MDKVFIRGLKIDTVIGVYDWERKVRQTLLLDVEMQTNIRPAAAGDDLNLALDYHSISLRLQDVGSEASDQLIETLAERFARIILSEYPVSSVALTLSKPGAVPDAQMVGVCIERNAEVSSQ